MASGSGWNLWVCLLGVVVRRYIDFLILLIPTPLVSALFCSSIPTFCSLKKRVFSMNLESRIFISKWCKACKCIYRWFIEFERSRFRHI